MTVFRDGIEDSVVYEMANNAGAGFFDGEVFANFEIRKLFPETFLWELHNLQNDSNTVPEESSGSVECLNSVCDALVNIERISFSGDSRLLYLHKIVSPITNRKVSGCVLQEHWMTYDIMIWYFPRLCKTFHAHDLSVIHLTVFTFGVDSDHLFQDT